jgi:hypothetical protein
MLDPAPYYFNPDPHPALHTTTKMKLSREDEAQHGRLADEKFGINYILSYKVLLKREYLSKTYTGMFPNCPTPPPKKYI